MGKAAQWQRVRCIESEVEHVVRNQGSLKDLLLEEAEPWHSKDEHGVHRQPRRTDGPREAGREAPKKSLRAQLDEWRGRLPGLKLKADERIWRIPFSGH